MLLLEGKANFKGCGTLNLPSSVSIQQAPPDVVKRLHAITSVDLTKKKVGFELAGEGSGHHPWLHRIAVHG